MFWGASTLREPDLDHANVLDVVEMRLGGVIRPHISTRYSFEDAPQAIADLLERRATGKVIVEVAKR